MKLVCGDAPWLPGHFELLRCRLPSWVYPVKVLHHLLGSKDELHILASSSSSSSSSKQQAASSKQKVQKSL